MNGCHARWGIHEHRVLYSTNDAGIAKMEKIFFEFVRD
jgi:hypothetical protein